MLNTILRKIRMSPSRVEIRTNGSLSNRAYLLDEIRLNEELIKSESKIAAVVRTIEITLALAANCHYAYQQAEPELKTLFVRTFFKQILIKDKQIVQATLNEPLDYLCRKRLQKYPVFDLTAVSGRYRTRTYGLLYVKKAL